MTPYSRQNISKEDISAVSKVLKSNFLTQGPNVPNLEKKIKKYVKSKFALAVNSATSGLHLSCLALNVKKNDVVWTVPNTFAASANCALNCGATVDFVDIDPETLNICTIELEKKLKKAKKLKKLPKVVIPVHFSGQPTEQKKIWSLAKKFNFKVIEDASHSLGATHYNEKVGSCKWSDITVFSFHPVKIITTGEGGMVLTNNRKFAEKISQLRNNGITKNNFIFKKNKNKPWYYEHQFNGYNYRMNDISAALGIAQFKRLNFFVKRRNEIAKKYREGLKNVPLKFQKVMKYNFSSYHLLPIQFNLKKTKLDHLQIFEKFRRNKYFVNLHYMPLHLSPYFRKKGYKKNDFRNSEIYASAVVSVPIFIGLKNTQVKKIINLIKTFYK